MGSSPDPQKTTYDPPEWTRGEYPGFVNEARGLASRPYEAYGGQQRAEINPYQQTAMQLTADRALYGDPQLNAARGSLMNISQGGAQNPHGDSSNPFIGAGNEFKGMTNPYLNDKYLNENIANTAQDMASAHAMGTA